MANTDAPNGFTPAYHLYGGVIRPQKLRIASATNASIFTGDVVNLSSGYVIQGTATGTPAVSFIGNKYTISTTAGSTNTGRSKEGVTATTSSGIALCNRFVDSPSNSIGANARAYFTFPTNVFAV